MLKNEKGFSLIEAIISLVIVSKLTLVSFPFVVNLYDYIRLNQMLTVLQADLHYARTFSMMPDVAGQRMSIRIYHEENRYTLVVGDTIKEEREFPRNIVMPHNNRVSTISFNANGNLGQGRTFHINGRAHERRLVFSIGVGGFDVRH